MDITVDDNNGRRDNSVLEEIADAIGDATPDGDKSGSYLSVWEQKRR